MSVTERTFVDPRVDLPAAPAVERQPGETLKRSVLDELTTVIAKPDIELPVRTRPGWSVRFSTMVDADLVDMWAKAATGKDGRVNQFQLTLSTLAGHCRGLVRQGEQYELDGQPATFAHPGVQQLYGCLDVTTTVRAFYGDDALVSATYLALLEACGAGERVDPTNGSSG